ncbi:hypothetical protein C8J57DRAFT_1606843 [Mycena rebaudengoi]|nr:hypothetical protein C8J57DRAFT_1606843 [Mycena rebaudengoi]
MPSADRREMASADRPDSPDDREKDDARGGSKKSAASKAKDLSHVPCKFYKVGSCTAGSSCPFSHSMVEPGGQKDVCAWFVKGNCKFGHKCALAHVLPGQPMAMDRKNKKAAQIAAGGSKNNDGGRGGGGRGGGSSKRDGGRNALLAGGSTAPTRARPPMNMALKASISPSAPAPPLKDTDFASFAALDESAQLPTAPARNKSPTPPTTKPPSPVTLPNPARTLARLARRRRPPPRRSAHSTPAHRPAQVNGFLSTSPFSAPVFRGYGEAQGARGMAASLGSGIAMGGGPGGWGAVNGVSASPLRGASSSLSARAAEYDISIEYEDAYPKGRGARREASSEDLEDFLPSSLTDLLTPEERSRRMSRSNSGQPPGLAASPNRHGLGVPLAHGAPSGHRYSRSVPAPSLLGGDLKSIWSDQAQAPPLPVSPMGAGHPSSYSSASGFPGRGEATSASTSYVDELGGLRGGIPSLSPSNASGAFLPGLHHYINANKTRPSNGAGGMSMLAANAAHQQGPPGIAHYLQAGPGSNNTNNNNNNGGTNASGQPYVRPNPFDLTQQMHLHNTANAGNAGNAANDVGGGQMQQGGGDAHILSPNARALQAHAPGQSLPQGLAAGYSRIHALPPLHHGVGSPSPGAFGTSPGVGGGGIGAGIGIGIGGGGERGGMRDWATMSAGSVGGSPGLGSLMSVHSLGQGAGFLAGNNNNNNAGSGAPQNPGQQQQQGANAPPQMQQHQNQGQQGLDAMFSRLSYSAAAQTRAGAGPGPGVGGGGNAGAAPPMQRNVSGGSAGGGRWQASPPSRPVGGARDVEDDLFPLDE